MSVQKTGRHEALLSSAHRSLASICLQCLTWFVVNETDWSRQRISKFELNETDVLHVVSQAGAADCLQVRCVQGENLLISLITSNFS